MKNQSRQLFRLGTLLAGLLSAASLSAATLVLTTNAPTPGSDDIYNFQGGVSDTYNVNGGDDAATYAAYDRFGQGQTFTTGSSSLGYILTEVWVQHCAYTQSAPSGNGTWWTEPNGAVTTIQITDPSKSGQAGFALDSETYTWNGTENYGAVWSVFGAPDQGSSLGDGMWQHFTLSSPVVLAPNKMYGFDVTCMAAGGGFFEWYGNNTNVYSGGFAYSGTATHLPPTALSTNTGDRVFYLHFSTVLPPTSPSLTAPLRFVSVGQSVNVTATISAIENRERAVSLILTNNNPSIIRLPGSASTLTLNFAQGATNAQSFSVQVVGSGVGSVTVVTNAAFLDASILIGTPVLAAEEFQYDPAVQTALDGANGGSGFGGAWYEPNLIDTIADGLTYTADAASLVTSSNAASVTDGNLAFRALSGTYGGPGGGSVWISALVRAPSGLFTWGGFSLWTGTNSENLFIGEVVANSANNTWGFSQGGNYYMSFSDSLTPGAQVDFLVCRIDFPATNGGQALVSFYANPTLNGTYPYSPDGWAYLDSFTFDTIRLGCNAGDSLVFDEVRVGSSWADVMHFSGTRQVLEPPLPDLSTPSRLAPVGYAAAITVTIPTNSPLPITIQITNDNSTAFSLSSTNAARTSMTFSPGGTNVQVLNVQVLGGGAGTVTFLPSSMSKSNSIVIGSQAAAVDEFQDADGSELLAGQVGGIGWGDVWAGSGSVITPGLVYPGLWSSSNSASLIGETATRQLFAIPGNYGGAGGGTVWISFLVRGEVPTGSFGVEMIGGGTSYLLLGINAWQGGTTWGWAGQNMGATSVPTAPAPSTNVDLLVYRLDFPANANDLVGVTLYADPPVGSNPPASPTGNGSVHYFTFDTLGITAGGATGTNDIDEIRIGGTWASVMPGLTLNIQKASATQVQIAWPAGLIGVELQSSTSLTGGWGPAGLSVSTVNGQSVATDTITGSAKFYRLHQQ